MTLSGALEEHCRLPRGAKANHRSSEEQFPFVAGGSGLYDRRKRGWQHLVRNSCANTVKQLCWSSTAELQDGL